MTERVPSARVKGVVRLPGYMLTFHKRSWADGSGKGMLKETRGALAFGVLYEFDLAHKAELDRLEGRGNGYNEQHLRVPLEGRDCAAYVYMAAASHIDPSLAPFHWYKNLVLAGAVYHDMPQDYIASILSVPSVEDPDENRRKQHEALLGRLGWPTAPR